MSLRVLEAGPLTTVQDLGRAGQLRVGIPPSGPIDRDAFVLGNRLVDNPDGAAGLECTLMGPGLEFADARWVAVTGAEAPVTLDGAEMPRWASFPVRAGGILKIGAARAGVRVYLAVSGGLATPAALGSRATYLRGGLGGMNGRAIRKGDVLPLGTRPGQARERRVRAERIPGHGGEPDIATILGPQADRFSAAGIAALFEGPYEMLPQSDRMGARFKGPRIEHTRGHDIISDGIALGAIQVIGDGQPIVLLVDRQTAGGYTKIGAVCSYEIGRVGQMKPGQKLRFKQVSVSEAHAGLTARRAALDSAIA
ncbi:MAG TPA: biotin-dependent carboxyltransferase family protein [Candidatus Nitrosocosmicus sp.]|nr:biotin-dependent carboxyltransferase family protein [Candidatus Nitrosocosmicus sp.]